MADKPYEEWIVIPNWDDFQHPDATRTGNIPWIKSYTRLQSDRNYLNLTFHQRGLLHSLWLEYARARRQLSGSTLSLTRQLGHRVATRDLKAIQQAGFITITASKPQAESKQPASLDKTRQELKAAGTTTETKTSPARDPQNPPAAELNDLLNQLGITGGLRIAALQDPDRGLAVAQSVLARGARNPGGLFRTLLENGGTPAVMAPTRPRVAPCASCGVGGGRHLVDCDSLNAVA